MKINKKARIIILLTIMTPMGAIAQQTDTTQQSQLKIVRIKSHRSHGLTRINSAENGMFIGQSELFRAACCNLGESFLANPSVDVNYNDAATGARQIKLLGLSGQYVQMLTEGLPMSNGAAMPYLLSHVPGAWMKSIAVSKGASSVKNGFQSITGQIDITYLKPEDDEGLIVNLYGDHHRKAEANIMGNIHLNQYLSTEILAHYEHDFLHHSDDNGDGWTDVPAIQQINLQNRWKYTKGRYIFHGGVCALDENRQGGTSALATIQQPVEIDTRRYEAYMKHAYLLNQEHNSNIALMATASHSELTGQFFHADYRNRHIALNASLILEHEFSDAHNISTGLSLLSENLNDTLEDDRILATAVNTETPLIVPGVYAQYTYKPDHHFTLMAGIRADHIGNNYRRALITPRLHVKWTPTDHITLRASSGKGYRIPYALAENHYLLAAWRPIVIEASLPIEEAWNSGIVATIIIPTGDDKSMNINAEYYYTHFTAQTVIDYDSDPTRILITALDGKSYSHTAQVDASYSPLKELDLTAAFRLNDVRCTYGGVLREKPLTSRYKALFTAAWKPHYERWQVDVTFCINGAGRLPAVVGEEERTYPAYPSLNMQLTRRYRHWSLYVGGENITNYRQKAPVLSISTPESPQYDPALVYGPIRGLMIYAGVRLNFWKD